MPQVITLELPDLAVTLALGRKLGELAFPNMIVALVGQLGAGKTVLARGVALGMGVTNNRVVTSPTFVLIQEYQGRLPIFHFDAYRLNSAREFFDLGAHEYFETNGVSLVEWADRVASCLPAELLTIKLTVTGATSRQALVEAQGVKYESLLTDLKAHGSTNLV